MYWGPCKRSWIYWIKPCATHCPFDRRKLPSGTSRQRRLELDGRAEEPLSQLHIYSWCVPTLQFLSFLYLNWLLVPSSGSNSHSRAKISTMDATMMMLLLLAHVLPVLSIITADCGSMVYQAADNPSQQFGYNICNATVRYQPPSQSFGMLRIPF